MTNDDRPSSAAARKAGRPTPEAAREISSRITAAAEDLFVELGYERTTMDEVARRAQVSKRTLYARFPGKDDLFLAAVERGSDRKIAELEAVRVRKGALPLRLEDFARKLVAVLTEPRFIAFERIMAAEAGRFPAVTAARSRSGIERVSAIVSRVLREDPPFSAMDTKELMLRSQIFLAIAVPPLVSRALYGALLDHGIEIHEYERSELHAKAAVVDGRWATVGSSNLDPFSLFLAREANVAVFSEAFAREVRDSIEAEMRRGARAVPRLLWRRRPWRARLTGWLAYGCARIAMGVAGIGRRWS